MIGSVVGNYHVQRTIGRGGMGTVYEAVQQPIGRKVALKVLHSEYANDPDVLKRFFNEARAANLINHPSIVQVSDYGQLPSGAAYLVMEYLTGETLAERLSTSPGRLSPELAQHMAWQLASALSAAHAAGIVHRDLKPGNIMLTPDAVMPGGLRVKILDFGIAKLAERGDSRPNTRTGSVLGTPAYMAPEQCKGELFVDGKTDVYALGVILFEVLAGKPPFSAPNDLALLNMQVSDDPPNLQQKAPRVPSVLANWIHKMLKKKPADRPTMAEVFAGLQRLGASQSLEHAIVVSHTPGPELANLGFVKTERHARVTPPSGIGQKHTRKHTYVRTTTAAVAIVLAVLFASLALRSVSKTQQRAASETSPKDNRQESSSAKVSPSLTDPPLAPSNLVLTPPPSKPEPGKDTPVSERAASVPPSMVTIELETTPSGAQVFDAERDSLIGKTPWSGSLPGTEGDRFLLLRKPGFHDRMLRLKLRPGISIQRHEVLLPTANVRKSARKPSRSTQVEMEE